VSYGPGNTVIPVHFYIPVSDHATVYLFFTFQYIIKHNLLDSGQYGFTEYTKSVLGRSEWKGAQMYLFVWPILSAWKTYDLEELQINSTYLGQVQSYKYLGSVVNSDN
jgi:hypothetical protein